MVLDFNWTGEYTRPGPRLYPHQWSWDSALISLGYSHYNPERAMQELRQSPDAPKHCKTSEAQSMADGLKSNFHLGGNERIAVVAGDCYGFGFSPVEYWRGPV